MFEFAVSRRLTLHVLSAGFDEISVLFGATEEDFKEVGLSVGSRRKLCTYLM